METKETQAAPATNEVKTEVQATQTPPAQEPQELKLKFRDEVEEKVDEKKQDLTGEKPEDKKEEKPDEKVKSKDLISLAKRDKEVRKKEQDLQERETKLTEVEKKYNDFQTKKELAKKGVSEAVSFFEEATGWGWRDFVDWIVKEDAKHPDIKAEEVKKAKTEKPEEKQKVEELSPEEAKAKEGFKGALTKFITDNAEQLELINHFGLEESTQVIMDSIELYTKENGQAPATETIVEMIKHLETEYEENQLKKLLKTKKATKYITTPSGETKQVEIKQDAKPESEKEKEARTLTTTMASVSTPPNFDSMSEEEKREVYKKMLKFKE